MSDLPSGWMLATIPDLTGEEGVFIDGDWVESKDQDPDGDVRLIQLADVGDGFFVDKSERFLTSTRAAELRCTFLSKGDVLIARMPDPLGRACIFPGGIKRAVTVVDVCIARSSNDAFDHRWLMHFVNANDFRLAINSLQSGSTRKRISRGNLATLKLPLPPRSEQTRIVAKLEELLSGLDVGVTELKAAQKKLAQYRQSLLKAAVQGDLTADWRRQHPQETGDELLARILKQRRERWQAKQLAKFAEQGKPPPKGWQDKYSEPAAPNTHDLPALPEGWVWASLDQVSEIQGGIQKQPCRIAISNRFPFLRVANVARGALKLDDVHEIELFEGELQRLALQRDDLLIVEGNGSLTEIGRCALWDGSIPNAVHQNHLIRARPILVKGAFVETWLNSPRGIERMTALAGTTSGLYTLSVGKLAKLPIPIAPILEQEQALEVLNEQLAGLMSQSVATELALKQSTAQRQNILRAAFAGTLVPQDPSDEPASVLLERIRTERAGAASGRQARKPKKALQETP